MHPLRWPGSVHTKADPRLATILDQTENEVDLDEALAILRGAWKGEPFGAVAAHDAVSGPDRVASEDDVASALAVIPNEDASWDRWKTIGMAVYAATEGKGLAAFDAWSKRSAKYDPRVTAAEWRKIRKSPPSRLGAGTLFYEANQADPTWVKPSSRIGEGDDDFAELTEVNGHKLNGHTHPLAKIHAKNVPKTPNDEFPDHLTRVPGLLGRIVDWIESTARQPSRVMALGAALTVLGTLMGRRMAGPTGSGTHLYTVAVAPSAVGKDHNLRAVPDLLKAANADHMVGPDEFMSQTSLVKTLVATPCCACAMDEIGAFIRKLTHPHASSHEAGIMKTLRSAWGASFRTIQTPKWANSPADEIEFPALSIYGCSTPGEFFEALKGFHLSNGFLNRFLLLQHTELVRDRSPENKSSHVPASLTNELLQFKNYFQVLKKVKSMDLIPSFLR